MPKFGSESFDSELSAFYVHVGSEWKQRKGVLFVGKTNEWLEKWKRSR